MRQGDRVLADRDPGLPGRHSRRLGLVRIRRARHLAHASLYSGVISHNRKRRRPVVK